MTAIKYRHYVPLIFMVAALGLAIFALTQRKQTTLKSATFNLIRGQEATVEDIALKVGPHYRLVIGLAQPLTNKEQAAVSATMTNMDTGGELFSVEDNYWRDMGQWYEDGESGTWDEANAGTSFDFRVPEDGNYNLDLQLLGGSDQTLRVALAESRPFALAEWPLILAALVFLMMAIYLGSQRKALVAAMLDELKVGARLRIEGADYTLKHLAHVVEPGYPSAAEFTLRGDDGSMRYLSSERFEHEYENFNEDDVVKMYKQFLFSMPLTDEQRAKLENDWRSASLEWRGEAFHFDPDNSGSGWIEAWGAAGQERKPFDAKMFRPNYFPTKPGSFWLERCEHLGEDYEVEWSVLKIISWDDIEILDADSKA